MYSPTLALMKKRQATQSHNNNFDNEEFLSRHRQYKERRDRAINSMGYQALPPLRRFHKGPKETNQFAQPISTKFLDDRRLGQGAKNLLVRLVALAGRGDVVDTNKNSLAKIMGCSARSIQRYIKELHIFDYITRKVRVSERTGFDIGLKIFIEDNARPIFKRSKDLFDQILQAKSCRDVISSLFVRETDLSQINTFILNNTDFDKKLSTENEKIPI